MIKEGKRGKTDMASFTFINYGWVWFGLFSVFYVFIFYFLCVGKTNPPTQTHLHQRNNNNIN